MKEMGKTIIFISHKLDEVLEISDRITIMRSGRIVSSIENKNLTKSNLAKMMVGKEVILSVTKKTN